MTNLPFSPFNSSLKQILFDRFIKKTSRWLLDGNKGDFSLPDNTILAQMGGSVWETSFSLIFLCEVAGILGDNDTDKENQALVGDVRKRVSPVVKWIMSRLEAVKDADNTDIGVSWDGNTFDTAVAVRALLIALPFLDQSSRSIDVTHLHSIVVKAFQWLFYRFDQWEVDVKYPVAASDVSEIMLSLLLVQERHPDLYRAVVAEDPASN